MKKLFLLLFLISINSYGNDGIYECSVKTVSNVKNNGELHTLNRSNKNIDPILSSYIGTKFTIEKKTGVIKGNVISNQSSNLTKTTVLNESDGMNSFQVLSIFGPNPSILYIRVNDYLKKSSNQEYPFDGYRWGEYITGVCR